MSSVHTSRTNRSIARNNKPTEWEIDTYQLTLSPELNNFCNQILDKIIDTMNGWYDPVLRKSFSLDWTPTIRITKDYGYACTYIDKSSNEQIIMLDTKLIEGLNSIDEIAFAIAHEFAHGIYRKSYKTTPTSSATTQEEIFCDRFALYSLALSGFSPNASEHLFEYLIKQEPPKSKLDWFSINRFFVVHLTSESRWALVKEDLPGILSLKSGSQLLLTNVPLQPIPIQIKTACRTASYTNPIEHLTTLDTYTLSSPTEQIKTLASSLYLVTNPRRASLLLEHFGNALIQISKHNTSESSSWPFDDIAKIADHLYYQTLDRNISEEESHSWTAAFRNLITLNSVYYERMKLGQAKSVSSFYPVGAFKDLMDQCKKVLEGDFVFATESDLNAFTDLIIRAFRTYNDIPSLRSGFKVDFSLDIEKAFANINKNQSVNLAKILAYSYYEEQLSPEMLEKFDLEFIQKLSDSPDLFWSKFQLKKRVEQISKVKHIDSYKYFCASPDLYILEFKELLTPPRRYDKKLWPPGHPYSSINNKALDDEELNQVYEQAIKRVIKHLILYSEEHPDKAKKLLTDIFVNHAIRFEPILTGHQGISDTSDLVTFIASSTLLSKTEICISLVNVGCPGKAFEIFKTLDIYPKTLKELAKAFDLKQPPIFLADDRLNSISHIQESNQKFFSSILRPLLDAAQHTAETAEDITRVLFQDTKSQRPIELSLIERLADLLILSPTENSIQYYSLFNTLTLAKIIYLTGWHSLVDDRSQIDVIGKIVEERLNTSANSMEQLEVARVIIRSYNASVSLRKHSIEIIAKNYRHQFGIDDGSQAYSENVIHQLEEDCSLAIALARYDLKVEVAEQILAQRSLAFRIKCEKSGDPTTDAGTLALKSLEAIITFTGKSEERAKQTLEFFINPTSWESSKKFYTNLKNWYTEDGSNDKSLQFEFIDADIPRQDLYRINGIRLKHREFAALDVEAKALILKQLLLTPERLFADQQRAYGFAIEYALDKLFPTPTSGELESDEQIWSKRFMLAYVQSVHPSERGLILAALLSCHQESGGARERAGILLRRLLEHLGPAYIKLGQALHSSTLTPQSIRDDLSELKSRASKVSRWALFERIDDVVPDDKRSDIGYVGEILGSASFNIVARYRTTSGTKGALGLLRPFARDRASKGFKDLHNVWLTLSNQYPKLGVHRDDGIAVISHAAKSAELETNMRLAKEQHTLALQIYKDAQYVINGKKIRLFVPKWYDFGDEYRLMEEAQGDYFETLPNETLPNQEMKRAIAKAILLAEFQNILAGKAFDCDRHSHQYRIYKNSIGVFDHGGLSIVTPTAEDRQSLALVVEKLFNIFNTEEDHPKGILRAFNGINKDNDYVQRLQKALLAMAYLFEHLDSKDIKQVVLACAINGNICTEVEQKLLKLIPDYSKIARLQKLPKWLRNIASQKICGIRSSVQ